MKTRLTILVFASLLHAGIFAVKSAAAPSKAADLISMDKRRPTVELAERLAHPAALKALPADLPQPFNPPGFEQPDPEETRALAAAQALNTSVAAVAKPATDRELLAHIAARIQPSGTLHLGDDTLLIFGKKRLRPGDHITVTYDGQDYELELATVDQSTFTLRLNKEEFTRSLKPGKSP